MTSSEPTASIAWRRVKSFRDVGRARQVHLDVTASKRLINVCHGAFRKLVIAALLAGARPPHELVERKVRDFNAETGTLSVVDRKTGARDTVLTKEAIRFSQEISVGRRPDDLLRSRDGGTSWGKNQHVRPMQDAVKRAKLPEGCTLSSLRHSHASQALLNGMNLKLLPENLGTSE